MLWHEGALHHEYTEREERRAEDSAREPQHLGGNTRRASRGKYSGQVNSDCTTQSLPASHGMFELAGPLTPINSTSL